MKIYVGNLNYNVTSDHLRNIFAHFGHVRSAEVMQDRDTQRSKGYGFVEIDDGLSARVAIIALHEKEYAGRKLSVNEARPRAQSGGGIHGGGRRY